MTDLFKVEFFVEDKNLAKAKRALMGLALEMRDTPVNNAVAAGGKIKAATPGTMIDLFLEQVKKMKVKEVTPAMMRQFAVAIGRSEKSYSNMLRELLSAGVLKRKANGKKGTHGNHYTVVLK